MSKVKMEDISLNIYTGRIFYVDIDIFRFAQDKELDNPEVYIGGDGDYEFLEEIEVARKVRNVQELTEIALKWIIKNVSIVDKKEIEEEEK